MSVKSGRGGLNVSRGRKEIDERVKISVEESRCELHTQPRFASAHFFLYRLAKQRRKIERDNRFSATRLFLNLRAANVRVPTTFAYPGSCLSLVQLPLRSSRLVVRIRGQESVRRHVAMEINAPSSDFLVESTCVGWLRVVTGIVALR